eukprot:308466-Chlamydomonas_euryale.AAC.9
MLQGGPQGRQGWASIFRGRVGHASAVQTLRTPLQSTQQALRAGRGLQAFGEQRGVRHVAADTGSGADVIRKRDMAWHMTPKAC